MNINKLLETTISIKWLLTLGGIYLLGTYLFTYFMFGGIKEGFNAGLVGVGAAIDYKMGNGVKRSWENTDVIQDHKNPNALNDATNIYSSLEQNEGGPIPLPEDEMLFFDNNIFTPECCPSPYSTGDGCLCASPEQMKYLNQRGGNRTLTSEY
jgi:hypothetical protein